jgi:hypothetical protein
VRPSAGQTEWLQPPRRSVFIQRIGYQNGFHLSTRRFFIHVEERVAGRPECSSANLGQGHPLAFSKHEHNQVRTYFTSEYGENNLHIAWK